MVRPKRLTAALTALTVPWLAPQVGCSQLPLLSPSEQGITVPAPQPREFAPEVQKYLAAPVPMPTAPKGRSVLLAAGTDPTAPPQVTLPALPGDSGWAQPADVPLPDLPVPAPEGTDRPLPINLATALRLADARPLLVARAQARSWVAEAQYEHAKVIWYPQIDVAITYLRHDGYGPEFDRGTNPQFSYDSSSLPLNQNLNYFEAGGGLNMIFATTDAIYEPLATKQVLTARRWDIQAAKNDALQQTARAYFDVHRARGTYAGALDAVARARLLVARIESYAGDLVPRAEVDRAKRELADLEQQAASARENWRVASADLTQVLRLDPRAVVEPMEADQLQITMIDSSRPLDELIPIGLTNRPELAAQQALVQETVVRQREEKMRPLLPYVIFTGFGEPGSQMATQLGIFGIGSDSSLNHWSERNDFSLQFVWQFEGLGLGNMARVKAQRGRQSQELAALFRIQDTIAGDITRAQATVQSAALRVLQARRAVREAVITYDKNYEGLRQTTLFKNVLVQAYRPQEAVAALTNLKRTYDIYYGTVADYNRAQFDLYHALGYPSQDVSIHQPPGDIIPADTERPGYLPPVRNGPPPATR